MIELLSSIKNWFVRNGSASEWMTAFGTIGAVMTSLYLASTRNKVKLEAQLISDNNNLLSLVIINKSKNIANVSDIMVVECNATLNLKEADIRNSSQYNYDIVINANSAQKIEIYESLFEIFVWGTSKSNSLGRYEVCFIIRANNQMFESEPYTIEVYSKKTPIGSKVSIRKIG